LLHQKSIFFCLHFINDLTNLRICWILAQAERQAVNTKVQGSAADIVKKAMISIEDKIRSYFPDWAMIFPEVHTTRRLRSNLQQRGGYLVLQLHDELLYEVSILNFLYIYYKFKLFEHILSHASNIRQIIF